jgi:hypothetical protein
MSVMVSEAVASVAVARPGSPQPLEMSVTMARLAAATAMGDRADRPRLLATSDCERCRSGLVTQPVNTVSSLAYAVAGVGLLAAARRRPMRRRPATTALGWSLVVVGAGSVAYHGPGGVVARWAHDASLLAMTGLIALADVHEELGTAPAPAEVAAVGAVAAVAAHPRTSGAAQAATAAGALGAEIRRAIALGDAAGGRHGTLAAALFAAGLALHVAGRTGRPLCRPDSPLQAHAAWHALSAAALWLRTRPPR